jgi:2-methylcitrate dehydratase PrpD
MTVTHDAFDRGASLTSGLVGLIQGRTVSEDDLQWTAAFALDALASIIGGAADPNAASLLQWVRAEPVNTGRRAFLYGGLSTVLELDAMHRGSAVHAGTVVVPAVFAMARDRKVSGRAALIAILKGSEAAFRVGRAAGPSHYRIYQNTATCGVYGSAFAAGVLLGLGNAQLVHALGNAGTQSGGLWEYRETGAMTKQLHAGKAAEAGVVAAQLAQRGFTGPLKILEGGRGFFKAACPDGDPSAVLSGGGDPWELHGMSIKPWPSSRHTHPAIDAALGLAREIRGRPIASVDVQTYRAAIDLCGKGGAPNAHEGRSSVQYCVAAALNDGEVSLSSFDDSAFERHQKLARRVTAAAGEPFVSAYPKAWGAQVSVTFADGTSISNACTNVKGDPEAPLSRDEMTAKARALLALGAVKDADAFIESVLAMAGDGPVPELALP